MFDIPSQIIFPTHAVPKAGPLPPGGERLTVTSAAGETLAGVHIPGRGPARDRTLILGFAGNAWNAQDAAAYLHDLYPQHDVVAFHYRGYSPSAGAPSAKALIADAPLVFDAAVARVKPTRVIAVGFSIGTGVAAQLAATRKPDGLILVTPFDSLKAVAQSMYPWLPVGPFFGHDIDAAAGLKGSRVPVAILAAEHDDIIPAARTEALRKQVPNLVFDRTIERAGHNDIYARSDFHHAMHEALDRLKA